MIIKKRWVVRANINIGLGDHPIHEEFITRDKARDYKRLLKGMGNWENVKLFRATERLYDDNSIHIVLDPAR